MALPLTTSLAVAGITAPAALIAVSVATGFLSHEPLLILLGHRGARATREQGRQAMWWAIVCVALTIGTGLFALALLPAGVRWSLLLPVVPALPLTLLIARKQEKSALAEVLVALAFSLAAVPVCLAAFAPPRAAFAVAIAFGAIFVTATLSVRVVVLRVRGGGNPRAARATAATALISIAAITTGLVIAVVYGATPWATGAAAAPGLVVAARLALFPPPASQLRTVGWTLVATSAGAAVILISAL
jgi:hypothetical protein